MRHAVPWVMPCPEPSDAIETWLEPPGQPRPELMRRRNVTYRVSRQLARMLVGRALVSALAASAFVSGWSRPIQADSAAPALAARLVCKSDERLVACNVLLIPSNSGFITWADGTIEEAPSFTRPLWAYSKYKMDGIHEPKLRIGLIPKGRGTGTLAVRVRAKICPTQGPLCVDFNRVLKATVTVG